MTIWTKNGSGTLYYNNNKIKYKGEFYDGNFHGNGTFFNENGEYYIGQWFNNLKHGSGIMYNKDGTIKYEGLFIKDKYIKK